MRFFEQSLRLDVLHFAECYKKSLNGINNGRVIWRYRSGYTC